MWIYSQSTGELSKGGEHFIYGYAGTGEGRNNPAMQHVSRTGPLPRGKYKIGTAYKHDRLGPVCMNLDPFPENEMFGRSAFRIHGDNAKHDASLGCIILPKNIRDIMNFSADKIIQVIE